MRLLISKIKNIGNHVKNSIVVTISVLPMKLSHYGTLQIHIHVSNAIINSL